MENNELRKKVEEEAEKRYPDFKTSLFRKSVQQIGNRAFKDGFDYAISLLQQQEKERCVEVIKWMKDRYGMNATYKENYSPEELYEVWRGEVNKSTDKDEKQDPRGVQ